MEVIIASIMYFVAVIVIAHFFAPQEYHWIMQAGFIGFGVLLNLGFILKFIHAGKVSIPDALIMVY